MRQSPHGDYIMFLAPLTVGLPGLSPETKGFLAKWIWQYGLDRPVTDTVKGLAKTLVVTDRVVSRATKELECRGHLRREATLAGPKGRPRGCYHLEPQLKHQLLAGHPAPLTRHEGLIRELLFDDTGAAKRHPLTLSNRVLLAVLLYHADPCGAVRNLGLSDLSALTGMSRDRLDSQLQKLKKHEYILAILPGSTGSRIFGLTKTVYFLNPRGGAQIERFLIWSHELDFWREHLRYMLELAREKISDEHRLQKLKDSSALYLFRHPPQLGKR